MTATPQTDAIAHAGFDAETYIAQMTELARKLEIANGEMKSLLCNRRDMQFVDATPDSDLPRRILAAYIDESYTVTEPPALAEMMSRWQSERNTILRSAISKL